MSVYYIVIVGILPPMSDTHDYVWQQRSQQYRDLEHALLCSRRVNENTPLSHIHMSMFLIEEGFLPFDQAKIVSSLMMNKWIYYVTLAKINYMPRLLNIVWFQFDESTHQMFIALSNSMTQVVEDPIDIYWLTKHFYRLLQKNNDLIPIMVRS